MFIKNRNQYFNLDLAVTAETIGSVRGATALKLRDSVGREIGVLGGEDFDLEKLTAPLVPSSAVVIAITSTGGVTAHPVVAHRVLRAGAAEPVFAITPPDDTVLFQGVGAHGLARLDDGALYPNLKQAKAAVVVAPDRQAEPEVEPEVETVEPMPKLVGGRRAR